MSNEHPVVRMLKRYTKCEEDHNSSKKIACAGGSVEQDALGRRDSERLEAILVCDRQHNRLHQLLDLRFENQVSEYILRETLHNMYVLVILPATVSPVAVLYPSFWDEELHEGI